MQAILALEDGTTFSGRGIGAPGTRAGEVVFNTAMTGYQEILTDPSYAGQLVTLTASHVGNTGVNPQDVEAGRIHAAGLVIRHYPRRHSNWRATQSLSDWMADNDASGIAGIDTRALTVLLRDKGAQNGCLLVGDTVDAEEALRRARECAPMSGQDLARTVTVERAYEWNDGSWDLGAGEFRQGQGRLHVVCYDYGVKRNILRLLVDAGCRVTVVPARTPLADVLAMKPDGVMLSNGPGDPEPCDYAIEAIRGLLEKDVPTFGICLGHQLLALSGGAKTVKMKFGHHGANHPVKDLVTGQVLITSQNHGFAVDESSLPATVIPTHRSLFDGTLQGIRIKDKPAMGFQGHPEASPGPHDLRPLFAQFVEMMETADA
ncbi:MULTISPECIES: glutamine-hydrolyzing carbamoyl-phosphate synthase small subunit [unclassified Wenzhouxiangella]|uniref:glutamine-hydrolyzing carbamoyl-phosphate synthase small subunit n=1 Tax=unclassified Wenzhouxiangella TaxID=2613841 RepID=UPI000E328173|nr:MULTISPECIES: glutamine-hydrolyzing carbamoyl-phosphate synthase small subunit [unclassified Wenzhouxiangella]RFF28672.1 carbamoyl-phosphate synthase small subunit [Wenzhouxiangella sp. 15181]RFP70271.1 carbamoyl-phosphate synthase small subunit [Wenzhouxiangella sp. 15190]